ncbi:unnamed protein product [Prunus armeniaca]|uniref:Uncharacterized protein n=1 Tax=Prunus armeniaca TaxID=36596 RepID=A0A6J5VE94_PRUAR|nr:unnamed protein product [Prunus armeniaca]
MGQKPIGTMACCSSALSPSYTGNGNSPRHEGFWNKDGSGDPGSPEAIESLRRQTGLSEDGVRSPPPPPLILYASELGILPMDIPQREINLQETLATLGAHSVLQVEGITPKPLATSRDIMGPALFDLFDLMPIIQLVEGLQKKKARRTPKKREKARSVPVKNSVKRKPPEDVATGGDVMVRGMDSNGSKRFCSGTCFDKAKETGIVVSPGGPP